MSDDLYLFSVSLYNNFNEKSIFEHLGLKGYIYKHEEIKFLLCWGREQW